MTAKDVSNAADIIDVRDLIERFEELESELETQGDEFDVDDRDEHDAIKNLLDELRGNGGDEKWRGDWYPITLIHDAHFVDAMRELVEDIGDMPKGFPAYLEIDWDKTADNLRADYCSVEYGNVTYWFR
jgi:hypothetical protein